MTRTSSEAILDVLRREALYRHMLLLTGSILISLGLATLSHTPGIRCFRGQT